MKNHYPSVIWLIFILQLYFHRNWLFFKLLYFLSRSANIFFFNTPHVSVCAWENTTFTGTCRKEWKAWSREGVKSVYTQRFALFLIKKSRRTGIVATAIEQHLVIRILNQPNSKTITKSDSGSRIKTTFKFRVFKHTLL